MLINDADYGHSNWVSHAHDLQLQYEKEQLDTGAVIKTKVTFKTLPLVRKI